MADFLVLYQVSIVFESMGSSTLGFVELADARTVHLNENMAADGWHPAIIAAVLAHESYHVQQFAIGHMHDTSPIYWLEDIEGPAYAWETSAWAELRRDASGNITVVDDRNDYDFRVDNFLLSGGGVEVSLHNAYISQSRGIPPNTQYW
jgi:hypothetical protein